MWHALSPTALVQIEIEPIGPWYHAYEARKLRGHLASSVGESDSEEDSEEAPEVVVEDDIVYLRSLDPANCKDQDHYAVLGLKKYRYKASDEDIKKAHRTMVLRHHPDKRGIVDVRVDDDYFTCITKAYEILGDPTRRRAFDSVDPEFDDDVPNITNKSKNKFFEVHDIFMKFILWVR